MLFWHSLIVLLLRLLKINQGRNQMMRLIFHFGHRFSCVFYVSSRAASVESRSELFCFACQIAPSLFIPGSAISRIGQQGTRPSSEFHCVVFRENHMKISMKSPSRRERCLQGYACRCSAEF